VRTSSSGGGTGYAATRIDGTGCAEVLVVPADATAVSDGGNVEATTPAPPQLATVDGSGPLPIYGGAGA
jgi:hypothetical protein